MNVTCHLNWTYKTRIILAAVIFLIESVYLIVTSYVGIGVYKCYIIIPGLKQWFDSCRYNNCITDDVCSAVGLLTYHAYFWSKCSNVSFFDERPEGIPSASRTYNWLLIYATATAVSGIASIILIVVTTSWMGYHNKLRLSVHYLWIIISMMIILADLTAFIHYSLDIPHMTTIEGLFHFTGYTGNLSISHGFEYWIQANNISIYPPLIMCLIFCKGILIWFVNVVLLADVIKITAAMFPSNKFTKRVNAKLKSNAPGEAVAALTKQYIYCTTVDEPPYIPWVNVLCVPADYNERTNSISEPAAYHHYEHLPSINDASSCNRAVLNGTLERTIRQKNSTNLNGTSEISNIDARNITIHIHTSFQVDKASNHCRCKTISQYENRVIRIPRISQTSCTPYCSTCRALNFIRTNLDKK